MTIPVAGVLTWALTLTALSAAAWWCERRRTRGRLIVVFDGDQLPEPPQRPLQGSCGLCGRGWTYPHPSKARLARQYHHEFMCTFAREAA